MFQWLQRLLCLHRRGYVQIIEPGHGFGVRHLQTFLLFLCMTIAYAMRVNLSVALVAMTDHSNSTNTNFQVFDWDTKTKSLLLSSFFWGYIITQVPAGEFAKRYGAKNLLLVAIGMCSILNILSPIAAVYGGWTWLCAIRGLSGMFQGFIFPSAHTMISKWAPVSERGQMTTFSYSGAQFGTVVMFASSAFLASSPHLGWPSIFYIAGATGLVWCIFYYLFGGNSPSEHKRITPEEKAFIEQAQGMKNSNEGAPPKTPWKAIFTSMPFWSILIVHSTHNWGFWTLLTEMPEYMKSVLSLDIKQNALLSSAPYLAMFLMCYFFSYLSTVLSNNQCIPIKYSRKLFNSIGHWIPMCALIALAYTKETSWAIGLLTLAVGISAATYLGFQCSHIDIAPNFAGTLMGLTNCAANIISIIAPLTVGVLVHDDPAGWEVEWRMVFFIAAGFYFVGNLLFIIFSSTTLQPWNEPIQNQSNGNPQTQTNNDRLQSQA